jgi:hypothetical protein
MRDFDWFDELYAVIKEDGNIELQWRNKTKNNLQKY